MEKVVTLVIDAFVKTYHIPVSESVEAYIVPGKVSLILHNENLDYYSLVDPKGVLEEGEIYFHSSKNLSDAETGAIFNTVTGEVIVSITSVVLKLGSCLFQVGRNPTRLPSDMQKVCMNCHFLIAPAANSVSGDRRKPSCTERVVRCHHLLHERGALPSKFTRWRR
jgi:RNA-dependent RNA polymerase